MKKTGSYLILLLAPFMVMGQVKPVVKNKKEQLTTNVEFAYRMNMAVKRLTGRAIAPVFTDDFVLADVNVDLKAPRRFYNFSGDLSGRFIEVMTLINGDHPDIKIKPLVDRLLTYQKKDGRFGNDSLAFTAGQIGPQHMALLWGNGRLLVGLMTYYDHYKDPAALKAARRLGDFFLNTYEACSDPLVVEKLNGLGANGIICFTQYVEGLVMLSQAVNDPRYAAVAAKAYTVLPERGVQHSHGYLTTLRGVLYLYKYDHDIKHLNYVKEAYDELVLSGDYNALGSVNEYFGSKGERDEGCSTADFVRLSLELYSLCGEETYLEKGEFALLNALYFNQYYTGDFGHHLISEQGSRPDYMHASWWCCSMHGLRAMYEVRDRFLLSKGKRGRQLNLYLETDYQDSNCGLSIRKSSFQDGIHEYKIGINKWLKKDSLSLRIPDWSEAATLKVNGKPVAIKPGSRYIGLAKIKQGDVITIGFRYAIRVKTDKGLIALNAIPANVKGNLLYGPYLLGVDDKTDPNFTAEPNANIIYSKTTQNASLIMKSKDSYLTVFYKHGGYPSYMQTIIRPVSELTFDKHGYVLYNLLFAPDDTARLKQDQSMTEPWKTN
ncbi:beta-L-arabinofuranosidase domain-containing protein [Mucilaginibacter sp.]|uniref:beta-L-arabinofuranosidase domain-containing protein n=1 Tax=Mucilaginibacter sp. TaxID=1882438 RepID=UPI00356A9D0B